MKTQFTFFLIFINILSSFSQNQTLLKEPKVDIRVELLSIVFRLADCQEYKANLFPYYVNNIEQHFEEYKNHDLINYIKNSLRKKGISYDAVMNMAVSITSPPNMQPITPFSKKNPEERWKKRRATKFLVLLNQFYKDANCKTFFSNHKNTYQIAAKQFKKVFQKLDLQWYQNFYGQKPKGEFRIINALGNGGANYGVKTKTPDGKEIIYAVMGTWTVDSTGMPIYPTNDYFPTLLHEFNHSFVNFIVEKKHSELQYSGTIIYEKVKSKMQRQAYGNWETMYAESIVRAAVIKYLIDHNAKKTQIATEINNQLKRGFLWIENLVKELDRYSKNRKKYKNLDSFMPEIILFFNTVAENIKKENK